MTDSQHIVLCVDDEPNILKALKRLLRREDYRLITAVGGEAGLEVLKEHEVNVVISDQRMPQMSGTEFLEKARELRPDALRIILSGYTDIDSITESINKGHIYKFFLKPWNDQNLKLEIRQALDQYDLVQTNRSLHDTILQRNADLNLINENLESLVEERTRDLEMRNRVLELSQAILGDAPIPILGVSAEGMIVLASKKVQDYLGEAYISSIGNSVSNVFTPDVQTVLEQVIETGEPKKVVSPVTGESTAVCVHILPLSGRFGSTGVTFVLAEAPE
jgi:response regulator RpfG family c-di-GMP phosphodiesterase